LAEDNPCALNARRRPPQQVLVIAEDDPTLDSAYATCSSSRAPSRLTSGVVVTSTPRRRSPSAALQTGKGRVVRTLNEHYSVVEVDPGVEFEERATVEKL
jgi:hypothetical protein